MSDHHVGELFFRQVIHARRRATLEGPHRGDGFWRVHSWLASGDLRSDAWCIIPKAEEILRRARSYVLEPTLSLPFHSLRGLRTMVYMP